MEPESTEGTSSNEGKGTAGNSFTTVVGICGSCKQKMTFDKRPKLLSCLHTFCKQCCQRMLTESLSPGNILCPLCHQTTPKAAVIANLFTGNLNTSSEEADAEKQDDGKQKVCTACDEGVVTHFCDECSDWLCTPCVEAHRRVRLTKDHHVQSKDSVPATGSISLDALERAVHICPRHPQEQLRLFCDTCDQLTCRDCQLLSHKDHKYEFIDEAAQSYRQYLRVLLEKVREKQTFVNNAKTLIERRSSEISRTEARVLNDIKMFGMKLLTLVNRCGKSLFSDLQAICKAKKGQLNQKNDAIVALSNQLEYVAQFAEHMLQQQPGNVSAMLYTKKTLVHQLRTIMKSRCEVPNPNHEVDIRYVYDRNIAQQIGPCMGKIVVDGVEFNPRKFAPPGLSPVSSSSVCINSVRGGSSAMTRQAMLQSKIQENQRQLQHQMRAQMQRKQMQNLQRLQQRLPFPRGTQSSVLPQQSSNISSSFQAFPRNLQELHNHYNKVNMAHLQQERLKRVGQLQTPPISPETSLPPIVIQPEGCSPSNSQEGMANPFFAGSPIAGPAVPKLEPLPSTSAVKLSEDDLGMLEGQEENSAVSQSLPVGRTPTPHTVTTTTAPVEGPETEAAIAAPEEAVAMDPASEDTNPNTLDLEIPSLEPDASDSETNLQDASDFLSQVDRGSGQPTEVTAELNEAPFTSLSPSQQRSSRMRSSQTSLDQTDPSEDWCAVCKNGGDLLCCDGCPKVFHLNCHVPTLGCFPGENEEFFCCLCKSDEELRIDAPEQKSPTPPLGSKRKASLASPGLRAKEQKVCERILLELFSHEDSTAFHEPVSRTVTAYYNIIHHPMDFMTIKNRLADGMYRSVEDFISNCLLVFHNCAVYNSADSEIAQIGVRVRGHLVDLVGRLLPFISVEDIESCKDILPPSSKKARKADGTNEKSSDISKKSTETPRTSAKEKKSKRSPDSSMEQSEDEEKNKRKSKEKRPVISDDSENE